MALVGSTTVLAVGVAAASVPPLRMVAAGVAIVIGDAAMVAVGRLRHRRRGSPVVATAARSSGTATAGVAFAAVTALPVLVLAKGIGSTDLALLVELAIIGLVPVVAAGTLPAFFVRGVDQARRDAIVPALLTGAVFGAAAGLVVTLAPDALVATSDERLVRHAGNFAVAMTFLGLSQLLVHHLVVAGRAATALVHVGIAVAFQLAMTITATGTDTAVAVNAALAGAVVLFTGLVVTTVVSAPFEFVVSREEASDGPRRLGAALASLSVAAVAVRLATARPFWLGGAAGAHAADGSLSAMLGSVRGSDPHPPIHAVLTWVARQAFGDGILALRLPSLAAGTLLVPALYVAGKALYDRRVGVVAGAFGAFAPALVWFSTEARPPVLAALLATLSLLAMVRALRRGRPSDWALFGLAGAMLIWSHQLAWVHVAVLHGAAGLLVWRSERPLRLRCMSGWIGATVLIVAAGAALAAYRSGVGPPPALPPFEYATKAAPGEGTSLFPIIGSGVSALIGLHPPDVTSRLLALWPLGILVSLVALGKARSERGVLLVVLSAAPFAALFLAQVLGIPRHPAFALGWAATAIPMVVLLAARVVTALGGRWSRVRWLALGVAMVLAVGLVDQALRVEPIPRYDVGPLIEQVAGEAKSGDAVVFEPRALHDLIRYRAPEGVDTVLVSDASRESLERHRRVFVVAAFGLTTSDERGERVVELVKNLSAERELVAERGRPDVKMWEFA